MIFLYQQILVVVQQGPNVGPTLLNRQSWSAQLFTLAQRWAYIIQNKCIVSNFHPVQDDVGQSWPNAVTPTIRQRYNDLPTSVQFSLAIWALLKVTKSICHTTIFKDERNLAGGRLLLSNSSGYKSLLK